MEIQVREADPAAEKDAIRGVLERSLPQAAGADRIDWLYLSNPDGPARVWVAEAEDGSVVGTSAGYPRRMRLDGRIVTALNLSDFAFDASYRSLGPALRLLRATLGPMRSGAYAFSYDFPSQAMFAIYRRLGSPGFSSERCVRPVSVDALVKRKLGDGIVGSVVGAAGEAALRARDALRGVPRDLEVALLEGSFGAEFDALDDQLRDLMPVRGVRDAAYLDWRFGRHTMFSHDVLCARRNGTLVGYAVLRREPGPAMTVVDLFAGPGEGVRRGLVAAGVERAREQGAETLQIEVLAGSATARLAEELGFVRREESVGLVPYVSDTSPHAATVKAVDRWWAMGADRDI